METTTSDTSTPGSNNDTPDAIPLAAPDAEAQEAECDLLAEKAARMDVLVQVGVLVDDGDDNTTTDVQSGDNRVGTSNASRTAKTSRTRHSKKKKKNRAEPDNSNEVPTSKDSRVRPPASYYEREKVRAKKQQYGEATRLQMDVLVQTGILSDDPAEVRSEIDVDEYILAYQGRVANSRSETIGSNKGAPESFMLESQITTAELGGTSLDDNAEASIIVPVPPSLVQGRHLPIVSTPGAHRAFPTSSQEMPNEDGQEGGGEPRPCLLERAGTVMIGMDASEHGQHQQTPQQQLPLTVPLEEGGLAQATPVDDLDVPNQDAVSVDLEEHRASIKQKQHNDISATIHLVLAGLLLLVIVVIGVAVGLTRLNKNSSDIQQIDGNTSQIFDDVTQAPTSWTWDLPFTVPNSTLTFFYHDTEQVSPQFRAYKWMKKDPHLNDYSESRLLQRFVLVTFYYATGGEHWTHQGGGIITVEVPAFGTLTEFTPNQAMPPLPHHPPPPKDPNSSSNNNHGSEKPKGQIVQYNITSEPWLSYQHSECTWFSRGLASPYMRPACDEDDNFQQLDLASNNLRGRLPPELGLLTSLKVIGLGRNRIGGPLFTEIGNLRKLEGLHLTGSTNQVTGSLPSEIGLLSDTFHTISINDNDLSGTLPAEFWRLSNLREIKLSRNKLSGTLPSNIGRFIPDLKQLLLGGSKLSGTIPSSLGLITGLVNVDLVGSRFVGSIPTELSRLEFLTRLTLTRNQLRGQVPSELGLLPFLRDLWLPHNDGITGQLPTSLEHLSDTLGSLRIHRTGITGTIPAGLCGIDDVRFDCSETLCGCQCPCHEQ